MSSPSPILFQEGKRIRKEIQDEKRLAMLRERYEQKRLTVGELMELERLERKVNRT